METPQRRMSNYRPYGPTSPYGRGNASPTGIPRLASPLTRERTSYTGTINKTPSQPLRPESWNRPTATILGAEGSDNVHVFPHKTKTCYYKMVPDTQIPRIQDRRSPQQSRGARHLGIHSPGPSTRSLDRRETDQPKKGVVSEIWTVTKPATAIGVEGYSNVLVFPHKGGEKVTKHTIHQSQDTLTQQSVKSNKSTTSRRRLDPAIREALTSNASIFQDPEFQELKEHYAQGSIGQEIQNVSDTLEADFQHVQENIDNILSDENED